MARVKHTFNYFEKIISERIYHRIFHHRKIEPCFYFID